MRIRHKPYARPELAAWPHHFDDPSSLKGHWASVFAHADLPLRLELGCGKGLFIARRALGDAAHNYLGIDIKSEMLVVAKRTIEREFGATGLPMENIALTNGNIERVADWLSSEDGIERIYINFCNPWSKSGYSKHRLTHPRQLIQYRTFLAQSGEIWFKTDDLPLFEDSLRYFELCAFDVCWLSRDLHRMEPDWNIRTEHETMFSEQGVPIKACIARMRPADLDEVAISRMKNV